MAHLRNAILWSAAATVMIFVFAFILAKFGLTWEVPDEFTYDWRTALFSDVPSAQRKDIALVLIDDNSVAQYWSRSPVDRGLIAELVKGVDAAQPKAIGLDFVFDRHSETIRDNALRDAIKAAKAPVILGATSEREGPVDPANLKWQSEFINSTGDKEPRSAGDKAPRSAGTLFFGGQEDGITLGDNVIRRMGAPPSDQAGKKIKTFDMLLAEIGGQKATPDNIAKMVPGNHLIAWLLRPKDRGRDTFATVYIPALEPVDGSGDGHTVLPSSLYAALKGKIVIIGADFIDRDQHRIPLSIETKAPVPGAFIHAQIVAQLNDGRAITEVPKVYEVGIVFLMCLAGYLIASRYFLFGIELFSHLVFLVAIVCVGGFLFWIWKIVLPTSTMLLGWLLGPIGESHGERMVAPMLAPVWGLLEKLAILRRRISEITKSSSTRRKKKS
jgi:adenylate cyclase